MPWPEDLQAPPPPARAWPLFRLQGIGLKDCLGVPELTPKKRHGGTSGAPPPPPRPSLALPVQQLGPAAGRGRGLDRAAPVGCLPAWAFSQGDLVVLPAHQQALVRWDSPPLWSLPSDPCTRRGPSSSGSSKSIMLDDVAVPNFRVGGESSGCRRLAVLYWRWKDPSSLRLRRGG